MVLLPESSLVVVLAAVLLGGFITLHVLHWDRTPSLVIMINEIIAWFAQLGKNDYQIYLSFISVLPEPWFSRRINCSDKKDFDT